MIQPIDKTLEGYSFIDLFAGIGGFRLALESLGANCVYSCEWEKNAQETYKANFGDTPDGDITKVNEKNIPDHDILCAGFPCQAFSISGKKRGFADTRGTLFFDVARIVREKKPKAVIMENVKNLVTHDSGSTFQTIINTMKHIGYNVYHQILNPTEYGIPQKRERVYIVAIRKDIDTKRFRFPEPNGIRRHVEDILDQPLESDNDSTPYSDNPIRVDTVGHGRQGERIYSVKGTAITLSANGGGMFANTGGYMINGVPRKLTITEAARLMGFPEDFKFIASAHQTYKQIGNAVIVDMIQLIAMQVSKLFNTNNQLQLL